MFALVSALLSGVAAVYTEWVLKKNNDTLYWQNILLYGFGSVFNFANLAHRCVEAGGGGTSGPAWASSGVWHWVPVAASHACPVHVLLGLTQRRPLPAAAPCLLCCSKASSGTGWNILSGYSFVTWLVVANLAFRWGGVDRGGRQGREAGQGAGCACLMDGPRRVICTALPLPP